MNGSGYGRTGEGVVALVIFLMIVCAVAVPLGVWKLVDLTILLVRHVSFS